MGLSFLPPGLRAGTSSSEAARIQACQCGHQDPGVSTAPATQSSNSACVGPSDQNWYFPDTGGLTTPAMWPEPAMT